MAECTALGRPGASLIRPAANTEVETVSMTARGRSVPWGVAMANPPGAAVTASTGHPVRIGNRAAILSINRP